MAKGSPSYRNDPLNAACGAPSACRVKTPGVSYIVCKPWAVTGLALKWNVIVVASVNMNESAAIPLTDKSPATMPALAYGLLNVIAKSVSGVATAEPAAGVLVAT